MNNSLISIIIPVYNVEPYLRRCLDSVVNQTYKNLEIILVDDGSTDKSGEICEEYKKKDKRIIVIHQKNQGLSAARNAGLDIFKGEYVSFIDSDDYVDLRFIEILYSLSVNNVADISTCSYFKIYKDIMDKNPFYFDGCTDFRTVMVIPVWNKFFKKEMFKFIRFPINRLCEDNFVFYPLLSQANRIASTSECLYFHTATNPFSITNITSKKFCVDQIDGAFELIYFAAKNDVITKAINYWFYYLNSSFICFYKRYRADKKIFIYLKKKYKEIVKMTKKKLTFLNKLKGKHPILVYNSILLYNKFKSCMMKIKRSII